MTETKELSDFIRKKAFELGFDLCGIARARALTEAEPHLRKWCDSGMNDTMEYLQKGINKRMDPRSLFPETVSVIVTGLNYYTENGQKKEGVPVVSRYAYGKTYQSVIKRKLNILLEQIKTLSRGADGKAYSDTAPIAEKRWAVEAGLGWQGRHSIVINREIGSFFFLGILLLNIELEYDKPFTGERCGNCMKCIDFCPTAAINDDFTVDPRKCISHLTIGNRPPVPEGMIPLLEGRIYACDKCQEVCPWNSHARQHNHPEFDISPELAGMTREEWANLTEEKFGRLFSGTPVGKVKFEKFRTNLDAILKNE